MNNKYLHTNCANFAVDFRCFFSLCFAIYDVRGRKGCLDWKTDCEEEEDTGVVSIPMSARIRRLCGDNMLSRDARNFIGDKVANAPGSFNENIDVISLEEDEWGGGGVWGAWGNYELWMMNYEWLKVKLWMMNYEWLRLRGACPERRGKGTKSAIHNS